MTGTRWALVGVIAACNTVGDVLNTAGMKRQGEVTTFGLGSLFHMIAAILRNPFVLGGLAALCGSFVALLMLLSIAPVSFAVPATAISYVLETLLAKHVLKEDVGRKRWAAATLVAIGVLLLQW